MHDSAWYESMILASFTERECRHVDLVASWETLVDVYESLAFLGPDNDDVRLTEFKAIVTEMNKFLTRMRNGLSKTKDVEGAIEFLSGHANTADMNQVRSRPNIAYNKLKQRWIAQSISVLRSQMQDIAEEGERDVD